jgi:hypothetical protein
MLGYLSPMLIDACIIGLDILILYRISTLAITTNGMSTQPVKFVATASISILNNADLPPNSWIGLDPHAENIPITWQGAAPDGRSSDTLAATFTQGLQVSYDVKYVLGGYIYVDSGSAQFSVRTVDFFTGQPTTIDVLVPSKGAGLWYYWTFGTADGGAPFTVLNGVVPRSIQYSVQRSGINYAAHQMSWQIHYTVTVVQDCNIGNITTQICQDLCISSLSEACYVNYNTYCLQGDPSLIATPTCKTFFTKWIAAHGSDENIDTQARKYCSARYDGFADLLEHSPKIPDSERLLDIPICACNLVAKPGPDPGGTVLYSNYFNSIVAQFPGFGVFGASIQQKCLVPACASATFKPAGVGPGGCSVPQCINLISITNDGTVNGDIVATASCQQTAAGSVGLSIATVVVIVIAVLIVIFIVVYFFTTPGSHRFASKSRSNVASANSYVNSDTSRSTS